MIEFTADFWEGVGVGLLNGFVIGAIFGGILAAAILERKR